MRTSITIKELELVESAQELADTRGCSIAEAEQYILKQKAVDRINRSINQFNTTYPLKQI